MLLNCGFWRRLLRVPWTARRYNQSILKEISPGCSLEGLISFRIDWLDLLSTSLQCKLRKVCLMSFSAVFTHGSLTLSQNNFWIELNVRYTAITSRHLGWLCMLVCVCMHAGMHMCVVTCVRVCTCVPACARVHAHTCVHAHMTKRVLARVRMLVCVHMLGQTGLEERPGQQTEWVVFPNMGGALALTLAQPSRAGGHYWLYLKPGFPFTHCRQSIKISPAGSFPKKGRPFTFTGNTAFKEK